MNFRKIHWLGRFAFAGLTVAALIAYLVEETRVAGGIVIGLVGLTALMTLETMAMQRAAIRLTKNLPHKVEKRLPVGMSLGRRRVASIVATEPTETVSGTGGAEAVVDVVKTLQAQYVGRLDRMQDSIDKYIDAASARE